MNKLPYMTVFCLDLRIEKKGFWEIMGKNICWWNFSSYRWKRFSVLYSENEASRPNTPKSCNYTKRIKYCKVSSAWNSARICPYKDQCSPTIKKMVATFITSQNVSNRAKAQRFMRTDQFICYAKIWNFQGTKSIETLLISTFDTSIMLYNDIVLTGESLWPPYQMWGRSNV